LEGSGSDRRSASGFSTGRPNCSTTKEAETVAYRAAS
jgi:hypothetical protein